MELTLNELYLFTWGVTASIASIYYSNKSDRLREELKKAMYLCCIIAKDEDVRKDFETNVANKIVKVKRS